MSAFHSQLQSCKIQPNIDISTQNLDILNLDCLLLIIEHVTPSDLISLRMTNKYFLEQVEAELRHRFSKKTVQFLELLEYPIGERLVESDDHIRVDNIPTVALVLQKLGDSIRAIEITTPKDADVHSIENIFTLIEEKCSESLVELHLQTIEHNFFKNISKPFKRVEVVSLAWNAVELGNDRFTFSDVFPALRRLKLEVVKVMNTHEIMVTFPALEHLSLHLSKYGKSENYITESVAMELIAKNPQIQSLILDHTTSDVVKVVNDKLLKLEHLELYSYTERGQGTFDFYFENVKCFKIGNWLGFDWPRAIRFGEKLEEFEIEPTAGDTKYIELIERSKGLKKLKINGKHLSNDVILRLAQINLHVTDVVLANNWDTDIDNIIQFVENNAQLSSIRLLHTYQSSPFSNTNSKIAEKIRKHFGDLWKIATYESEILLEKNLK